ncbi:MAG: glycoside hydrolase family 16 protein [Kiritimatiellae bacterium]|nr:glycoside hydrolase family 16 protein [Kiritimatiellia bacterium]
MHRFKTPYYESIIKNATILPNQGCQQRVPFDFHTDFHVYGFLWTPKEMVWFLDGIEMFRRNNDYYKTALHIMFDCEIMKGWVEEPKLEDLPATFYVDYMRLWRFTADDPFPKAKGF